MIKKDFLLARHKNQSIRKIPLVHFKWILGGGSGMDFKPGQKDKNPDQLNKYPVFYSSQSYR